LHRGVKGAGDAGIVALGGGRELDGRGHALGHPRGHGVAQRPQHDGEREQADADHHPLADRRFLATRDAPTLRRAAARPRVLQMLSAISITHPPKVAKAVDRGVATRPSQHDVATRYLASAM